MVERAPEEAAKECDAPLFRLRSAIREFVQIGLVKAENGRFVITLEGVKALQGSLE